MPTSVQDNVSPGLGVASQVKGAECANMARTNSNRPDRNSQTSRHHDYQGSAQYKSYVVLCLVSILCYANSSTGQFVFDDHEVIVTNVDIRPNSPLMAIFQHDFWGDSIYSNVSHKSYRPITIMTFRWNFIFGGLDPTFYHVVNICLHGVVTVLFTSTCAVLFTNLTTSNTCALLAGLLFAVHPIHTEAVSSIVGRADLLCALFYLLSFLSYTQSIVLSKTPNPCGSRPRSHSWLWMIMSIVFCVLSMLSKEQGLTVIAVCMVYDALYICSIRPKDIAFVVTNPGVLTSLKTWPKWVRRLAERLTLLMLSCVALLYIRIVVIGGGVPKTFVESDNPTLFNPDFWTRFRTYLYLCAFNARLMVCPNTLCFDWSMDSIARIETFNDIRNLSTLSFAAVLGLLTFKALKSYSSQSREEDRDTAVANGTSTSRDMNRNLQDKGSKERHLTRNVQCNNTTDVLIGRTILQGLAMLIIPFIPASNLFFPVGFVVAERVLYIPSMGFCILAALGVNHVFKRQWSGQTTEQDQDYKEQDVFSLLSLGLTKKGVALFYALLIVFAAKTIHRNTEWHDDGSLAAAGLKVNPTNAKIYLCMGNYLAKKGLRSCEGYYREAIRLRPHYTLAWVNLGLILLNTGRPQEAEYCYNQALFINPNSANANTNMGNLLRLAKRYDQAETHYRKALSLRGDDPVLYFNLGSVLEKLGKNNEAKNHYLQSITLMPSHSKAYFAVARILIEPMNDWPVDSSSLKTLETAEQYLHIGLRYEPNNIQARLLSAKVLLKRHNLAMAKSELFFVLSHDQHNIEAKYLVGRVMERDGKTDEAETLFQSILEETNHTKTIHALQRLKYKRHHNMQDTS